ncbi:MAG: agmatine deiminase family protein [Prolixibacteraceae bacterium]|nr:agmatine deiminase family protein [Prolixibacteraceae bacterium]MBN2773628.1 agmatine deiminase family protein [Prolixibacteraceae bacterium]
MKIQNRRLPAEFEPHKAILLSFPHEGNDWPGKYQAVQWAFVEFIKKVTTYENLILMVRSEQHQEKVVNMLQRAHVDLSKIEFIYLHTNRNWMRDSGPVVVKLPDGESEALHFGFNGWAKYGNFRKDVFVPETVANHLNVPLTKVFHKKRHVVLEGGAIDSNGKGTLLTTEECLLDPKIQVRNQGFTKDDYEQVFADYLGITHTIWLGEGIEGDDTHGHVDDICRFVNEDTVVVCREPNKADVNHLRMENNIKRLKNARLENGKPLNIAEIPLPSRLDFENMRLPASYINFLILNNAVLVPLFNDKNDYKALRVLKEFFPKRDIIGISAIDLIWGLGTLHCLSHEIPA